MGLIILPDAPFAHEEPTQARVSDQQLFEASIKLEAGPLTAAEQIGLAEDFFFNGLRGLAHQTATAVLKNSHLKPDELKAAEAILESCKPDYCS